MPDQDNTEESGANPGAAAGELFAAIRILFEVGVFRLKRLEMANMFAGLTIMLALHLHWVDMGVRLGFGLLLNLLAYLTNDYYDVDQDLTSPNKDHGKARFLKDHIKAAAVAQVALCLVLIAISLLWSRGLLLALIVGGGLCWAYSWKLKRTPYMDVLCMIILGAAMPLIGVPLDRTLGLIMLGQLALFSACFESIQIIRDHDEDVAAGVRTTAVRLGVKKTRFLQRLFTVLAAAYAVLLLHRWIGLALLAPLVVPFRKERAAAYWNHVRLAMGLPWLLILAWIYWYGASAGLLSSVEATAVISALSWIK